jgi:hypothetical protein
VVKKGIHIGNDQGRTGNSKPTSANNQKVLQDLRRGVRTVGHRPHRPNRHIPNHVTTRLLVHNGGHPSRCKLHLLQINKEPNQRQNDHGLPKMVDRMKLATLRLKHHRLDKDCLVEFKACIAQNGMTHELVPLDCHHGNITEWAIQMFKNHFVSILSGVDDRFPLSLWCHLVQPAELTINLLQQSNVAPKVSAFSHIHGQQDYMKCPFAPLGCTVIAHVKPKNRQSWMFTWTPVSTSGRQWSITNVSTSTL